MTNTSTHAQSAQNPQNEEKKRLATRQKCFSIDEKPLTTVSGGRGQNLGCRHVPYRTAPPKKTCFFSESMTFFGCTVLCPCLRPVSDLTFLRAEITSCVRYYCTVSLVQNLPLRYINIRPWVLFYFSFFWRV